MSNSAVVRFTKSYTTKVGNVAGKKDPESEAETFEEGQVVDFAELRGNPEQGRASARHFINKGVAVAHNPEEARAAAHSAPHESPEGKKGSSTVFPTGQPESGEQKTAGQETSGHKPAAHEARTKNR